MLSGASKVQRQNRRRALAMAGVAGVVIVAMSGYLYLKQRTGTRAELQMTFRRDIDTDVQASYRALLSLVRDFGEPSAEAFGGAVQEYAASLFAEGPLATDTTEAITAIEELRVIETVYPAFMANREAFGAIAYRLESIGARNDDLRARAHRVAAEVRQRFIETSELADLKAQDDPLNKGIWIKPGSFRMGGERQTRLSAGFYIQEHEVTNEEYRRFDSTHRFREGMERHPVGNATWYEAMAYAAWLGGSLPTEAQWELAARGTGGRTYPWDSDEAPTCEHAQYGGCPGGGTVEVMSAARGATPEGVYDLAGNVWEWVSDWEAEAYEAADSVDPRGTETGAYRVLRGGSFDYDVSYLRASFRAGSFPEFTIGSSGFRVVWQLAAGKD
ncbi:MAG: SUMF1/EgtB/PvdO family nonheme iron enzyme [Gemmatimonadota bacterium]|nr:MAG: SUMF1/EgtB/PvdO family nonheme iron enzyme [Gemmatimonadota bacterium]